MELRHRSEVFRRCFAFARLELLLQVLDGLTDELLCRAFTLRAMLMVGGFERCILTVQRGLGGMDEGRGTQKKKGDDRKGLCSMMEKKRDR